MKRFSFLLLPALFLFPNFLFSQSYITAFGVRVDGGFGLTLQQAITNKMTVEVIGHAPLFKPEFGLTALGERHHKILLRNLNVYYGAGGHYYWKSAANKQEDSISRNVFGLSFIGGAELSIGRLNFSVDYKPELHFAGDQAHPFEFSGASVSVRYIIEKKPRNLQIFKGKNKKKKKKGGIFN